MTTETGTSTRAGEPVVPKNGPGWGALAVVMVGTFITVLDYFITNVAVPAIRLDLRASDAQSQLVIVAYGVTFTAGMITGGRLGDLYGRRRMFTLGLAGFTLASGLCAVAQSADALVVFRAVQGVTAALMVPQVLGIIGVVYDGAARARAFVVYGLVIGLAGVFGQVIGGALISVDVAGLDWRTIFLINLPVGVVTLLLTRRLIPESRNAEGGRIDLTGAVLATLALAALVLSLVEGQQQGWPLWSWLLLVAVLPLGVGFVVQQRRRQGRSPLLDLAMFHSRTFSVGLIAMLTYFLAMGSFFFMLALYLQEGKGLSAAEAGLVFLTLGSGYFGSSLLSAKLAARLGHGLVSVGPLTLGIGYVLTGLVASRLSTDGSVLWLIPPLVVAGIGMGMTTGPLTGAVLGGADPQHAASASGATNTVQEGGAAIGVALVGAVFYPALGDARPSDYPHAFIMGLIPLVVFSLAVSVIVRFMRPSGGQS
ncbi:MFS transporter (plasmid) [Streptomyces sp. NBC_01387]|uniref:MFS transporter n=1 Tax=unclassified Streptomyces TaxID=2593676 RepID=UPI002024FC5D|nr:MULTISPECIES: MFS transporter [unclassified Streptomyces]MCX4554422.1 MFS transporter [Streptomyces sp. NBC_01500]WSC25198.1 MFS transporter [Streptomyces sp. NBC_01766]WSV58926.1 MFS transporter [Streptomyces sp. NBC_01014]